MDWRPSLWCFVVLACAALVGSAWGLPSLQLPRTVEVARSGLQGPDKPEWPDQYEVSWEMDIPYVKRFQEGGLKINFTAWRDEAAGLQKVIQDGVATDIENLQKMVHYEMYPRMDDLTCDTRKIGGGDPGQVSSTRGDDVSPSSRRLLQALEAGKKPRLSLVMPDLTLDKWEYNGSTTLSSGRHSGTDAHRWVWVLKDDEGYGVQVNVYTFYVDKEGVPLILDTLGANLWTGGHYDRYIATFYDYKPGPLPDGTFDRPAICAKKPNLEAGVRPPLLQQWSLMLPNHHYGDNEYDVFVHRHGRRHTSSEEYQARRNIYYEKKTYIEDWNQGDNGHKLGLNQFADWSRQEFEAALLPNRRRGGTPELVGGPFLREHVASVPAHMLPSTLDWRDTLADTPPKDQGMCGSCWAFGTVGAVEAAYFRATGTQVFFSEQNLIDCNWTPPGAKPANVGCFGGYQEQAFQWIFGENGGLATEEDYPYASVNRFCRRDVKPIRFNGTYTWVKGGNEALMEALYTKGPMTVSVDAAGDDFAFYRSGIYNNTRCATKLKGLDHAVLISGYGTTEDGHDYWLVKNTWSTLWGEDGYIRIAREPADCGIATQPLYLDIQLLD